VQGGAPAVFDAVAAANPRNLSVLRPDAAAGFGITLAFGLLAATVADQTFWQKVWAIRGPEVARTFFWPARCSIRSRSASACLGWSALPLG
jgi:hypothetical protein